MAAMPVPHYSENIRTKVYLGLRQCRRDQAHEDFVIRRLGQHRRAEPFRGFADGVIAPAGHDDGRRCDTFAAQIFQEFDAAGLGHVDVEDEEAHALQIGSGMEGPSAGKAVSGDALGVEEHEHGLAHGIVVVDDVDEAVGGRAQAGT